VKGASTPEKDTPETHGSSPLARLSPLLLYAGIATGMYLLSSGWAAILGYHLAICVALFAGGGFRGARALVRGWSGRLGALLVAVCLISGALIAVLWPMIHLEGITMGASLERVKLGGWSWLAFIAYYSLVNAWLEELYWRGWYPTVVRRGFVADLLFAGYHVLVVALFIGWPWVVVSFVILAGTAFVWRLVARHKGGLALPVAAHMTADVSIIVAIAVLALSEG